MRRIFLQSILGTVFILGFMGLLYSLTFLRIFEVFDPIGDALGDMEISDIVFSRMYDENVDLDTNVVLVNIGELPRGGIADQLALIASMEPKAIGIDAIFELPSQDTVGTLALAESMGMAENLVLAARLEQPQPDHVDYWDTLVTALPIFAYTSDYNSFANFITDGAQSQDDFKTTRQFTPVQFVRGDSALAFSVQLAQIYAPEKVEKLFERENAIEVINFRGNLLDYGRSPRPRYQALDVADVLAQDMFSNPDYYNSIKSMVQGKVVIMGYLGASFQDRSWVDMFYTPLNHQYAGKANPDMYGPVIHANIVSMIVNEDYINVMPDYISTMIGLVLLFANVFLFSIIYRRLPKWYDGMTKLIQLVEVIIIYFILLYIFQVMSLKVELTLGIAAVLLSGDSLEVFYGVVVNLFSKEGRAQLVGRKRRLA